MFSFFSRKSNEANVPEWASSLDKNQYNNFIKALDQYFYKKNISYAVDGGAIKAGPNDFGFSTLGLTNVLQVCKQDEPVNYHNIVSEHFDALIRSNQFEKEFKAIVEDYDKVKEYLGVRLYPSDYVSQIGENAIYKNFTTDVVAVLVFDLPDNIATVSREKAGNWRKSIDELFNVGIRNIKEKYPCDISSENIGGFDICVIQGDHFFAPNILFDLENHLELIGANGSLIGIPHRHAVVIYPVVDLEVIKVINKFIQLIYNMNEEGPGSISNNLFWYNNRTFENLPYKFKNNKINFYPPENFVMVLNDLSA